MIVLFGLLAVLVLGLYAALRSSVTDYDQQLPVSGLDSSIEIIRDANAIPHIYASSLADAYFALGFAHAQDRLWQMELMRAAANGRLSEIFGESTLATDKLTRTVDSANVARKSLARMSGETRHYFQRYVDGVNSYIQNRSGALPPEFLMFSVKPEPWVLADTTAFFALVALGADNWQLELERAALSQRLSPGQIDQLFPDYPRDAPISHTMPLTDSATVEPVRPADLDATSAMQRMIRPLMALSHDPLIAAFPASNTWVVHGDRTLSGKPLLASDPHGPLGAPADYYLAHLSGPDFNITGVGYVGMPVFAIGHNQYIAWGLTDIIADTADLFADKLVPEMPGYYQTSEGPRAFNERQETIKVRGQPHVNITVRSTIHGPVISDAVEQTSTIERLREEDLVLSLSQATLVHGNTSGQAFLRINQARNWEQFRSAMNDYEMSQNLSYADTAGNIGLISSAKVPLRQSGDGFTITAGWEPNTVIEHYLAPQQMLVSFNPPQGYLVNANNKPEPWQYPHFISREHVMPYRAEVIGRQLSESSQHDVASMAGLQGNNKSLAAAQLLPLLLDTATSSPLAQQAIQALANWDRTMQRDSGAPLIYSAWERELNRLLLADELGEDFAAFNESRPELLTQILTSETQWCDDIHSPIIETCAEMKGRALDSALQELTGEFGGNMSSWRWGDAHHAEFTNGVFTHKPILRWLSDARPESDGGPNTVNQARSDYNGKHPYNQTYGARYRQIIDLADMSRSRYLIAPGVSGNILSPYYKHLAQRWQNLEYLQFPADKADLLNTAIATTRLTKSGE